MPGISSITLVNQKGSIVLYRPYRNDSSRLALELFRSRITSRKREESSPPILLVDGVTFAYIKKKDLYFVANTFGEFNPMLALQFLYQLSALFVSYLGEDFGEVEIRNHFTLIYELLDETLDFGFPQNCSPEVLHLYILNGTLHGHDAKNQTPSQGLTDQITGKTEWRRSGIVYKQNQIFIDLMESVNCLVGSDGTVLRSDVVGEVKVRCYLSGMPECKLALNDRLCVGDSNTEQQGESRGGRPKFQQPGVVDIDDVTFHRCVRLGKFDSDRSIVFVPPDGIFDLLKYRISDNVNLPFRVLIIVDNSSQVRTLFNIRIQTTFPKEVTCQQLTIKVPVPPNTCKVNTMPSLGTAKFDPTEQAIIWRIRLVNGGTEVLLNANAELTHQTVATLWARPPLTLNFRVNPFTSSGLYVRNVRVLEASGYTPNKYVRYITKAGTYEVRF